LRISWGPAGDRKPLPKDPTTGHFSSAVAHEHRVETAKRFAYVAVLNRLYATPPPLDVKKPDGASLASAARTSPGISYQTVQSMSWPRHQWPRFGTRFIAMETALNRAAADRLAGTTRTKSDVHRIFDDCCTAPADALSSAETATLGWCMSWYGYLRPESIFDTRLYPAFGLAAWLAHLPDRPESRPPSEWFAAVSESLQHDLDASWSAWHGIACFMMGHGTYFLHPSLARPGDFAYARRSSCART
jgi:hypothetical protein